MKQVAQSALEMRNVEVGRFFFARQRQMARFPRSRRGEASAGRQTEGRMVITSWVLGVEQLQKHYNTAGPPDNLITFHAVYVLCRVFKRPAATLYQ